MIEIPLQLVDSFLLKVNLGDALIVGFALGFLAVLPKKSRKLLTLHLVTFGALFLMSPLGLYEVQEMSVLAKPIQYKLLGLVLLIVSPVLYTTADK
jgi:FtsH-binding integral membrane protein